MSVGLSFKLDASNDLVINTDASGNKTPAMTSGLFETQQAIRMRLLQERLEDVFHPFDGLPLDSIVGPVSPEYVLSIIIRETQKDRRVESVVGAQVDFSRENRILSLALTVLLKDGSEVDITTDLGV